MISNAERFANLLIITAGDIDLRLEGLRTFTSTIFRALEVGDTRLLAFNDGSILIDVPFSTGNELLTFDDVEELSEALHEVHSGSLQHFHQALSTAEASNA